MVHGYGNMEFPKPEIDSYSINWSIVDRLIVFQDNKEVEVVVKLNDKNDPVFRVEWLEKEAKKASITIPKPLEIARERVDNNQTENTESFEALLHIAKSEITEQTMKKNVSYIEHGARFINSKRGQNKMTQILEQELKKILSELETDATWREVINEIENLAESFNNPVFQEVDVDHEIIYFQDPSSSKEDKRSFKSIKNNISQLKKEIKNQI